jgi:hypothetical protein
MPVSFPRTRAERLSALQLAVSDLCQLYQEYGVSLEVERRTQHQAIDAEFAQDPQARWTDVERIAKFHAAEPTYQSMKLVHEIKSLEAQVSTLRFLIEHDNC